MMFASIQFRFSNVRNELLKIFQTFEKVGLTKTDIRLRLYKYKFDHKFIDKPLFDECQFFTWSDIHVIFENIIETNTYGVYWIVAKENVNHLDLNSNDYGTHLEDVIYYRDIKRIKYNDETWMLEDSNKYISLLKKTDEDLQKFYERLKLAMVEMV